MNLEMLESRLALSTLGGLPSDHTPPVVQSVSLPLPNTYGTGSVLTFRINFNEAVRVTGDLANMSVPVEVGYAMREARYVSGSGTSSLNFRMFVTANDLDKDGISLGRVNSSGVRDFDFGPNRIVDLMGNSAGSAIPSVNTSRIRVDATGPVVSGYGGFLTQGQRVSLQVTFDGPVTVTGKPKVPVLIGGDKPENYRDLEYTKGSGTSTLTFSLTLPQGVSVSSPSFRPDIGEVILLPLGSNLRDRYGNSVTPIGGDFGKVYTDDGTPNGNRVVVIGAHYEKLKTVSRAELDEVLTTERDIFNPASPEAYWRDYVPPVYKSALNDVDLYRVAYRSTIPEQGNRPTIAYGLVAIPSGAKGSLPMVSMQHGTLWLKESGPSQAFSWDKNSDKIVNYGLSQKQMYGTAYETRLNVAQFAGQGYTVIAPDYFGIGNSIENDSFVVKASEQQACMDMYTASQRLLASKNVQTSDLFLNGWSQGGLVALSFQEKLEERGIEIAGVSTAATPANTGMFAERFIFNRRPYSETTVPDAPWCPFVHQFSSFALGGYSGKTTAPLELLGGNYEVSRKFYMREFKTFPSFEWQPNGVGPQVPVMVIDGVTYNAEVSKFIAPKVASSPRAYEKTVYAGLIADVASGKTRLDSDMKMYYGDQDEGYSNAVCTYVDTWQRGTFGKTNIEQVKVLYASHRSTFLTAVAGQLEWFNSKRGVPDAPSGVVATLVNGGAAANLEWSSPAANGSPITGYRVDFKRIGDANWESKNTGSAFPIFTVDGLITGERYLFRVFAINLLGSGSSSPLVATGNQAPTAYFNAGAPNPVNGMVTGTVNGTDPDGDPLYYDIIVSPVNGIASVTSTGAFTYTPTAAARLAANAPGATLSDRTDLFTVSVADGYGGKVSVPVGVSIG